MRPRFRTSRLGQHGAGSSALQAVAVCLTIRRGTAFPTINHDRPDPKCGPIRVLTERTELFPSRVLTHSIGLGGFYYSVGAFEAPAAADDQATGFHQVKWSDRQHPRFTPTEEFQKPLVPWQPRRDDD